jgi:gluconokinase
LKSKQQVAQKVATKIVVMGVAGCGKSAMGQQLANLLGLPLIEGDDFHPPANVQKMQQGVPLGDEDRQGWLQTLAATLAGQTGGAVLTCSALKASYRTMLRQGNPQLRFVHLALTPAQALVRVAQRSDHFYPPSLVQSQFDALQDPAGEAGVLVLDATRPLANLAQAAAQWLTHTAAHAED